MNHDIDLIEQALSKSLPGRDCMEKDVIDAMEYSLMAGGKRIRPRLVLAFCRLCGGSSEQALGCACAVEMIHTYSLIHDDLPCMDDDEMRRGRPSNHIRFGEDIALLAGDARQALAFETLLRGVTPENAHCRAKAGAYLANACGAAGMVGGQVIDLQSEDKEAPIGVLKIMDGKKTGALIRAACVMGCICAEADDRLCAAAESYAESIGLAFQIMDDILDVTADSETLGKPVGSDGENKKSTYVSLLGIDKCKALVEELTEKAVSALEAFPNDAEELRELALQLAQRDR